jgi:hypothetical protein
VPSCVSSQTFQIDTVVLLRGLILRHRCVAYGSCAVGSAARWLSFERTVRAQYADDVGVMLVHRFPKAHAEAFARDMQGRLVELIEPASQLIQQVEAAWLHARRGEVTVGRAGQPAASLADLLEP